MAANRVNYIVIYKYDSQVYGCSTKEVALETAPPSGTELEDKMVLFINYQPDTETLQVVPISREEIIGAEIKKPIRKKKKPSEDIGE